MNIRHIIEKIKKKLPPIDSSTWFIHKNDYIAPLFVLIFVSIAIRALFASVMELNNTEAYLRALSFYPMHSYFDQPPMAAQFIRVSVWGALTSSELLIRFASVILSGLNTYIVFHIGRSTLFRPQSTAHSLAAPNSNDNRRGFIAALLYTGSLYASLICGIFATPDSALSLFWLLAIHFALRILPQRRASRYQVYEMFLFGIFCGYAFVSQYTGVYLLVAAFLYIMLYYRAFLTRISLYSSLILLYLAVAPSLDWNVENDYITYRHQLSYLFNGGDLSFSLWNFFGELFGSLFYAGVFNIVLLVVALLAYFRDSIDFISRTGFRILFLFSVPFIGFFLLLSLIRPTVFYWSGCGYFAILIFLASYLNTLPWDRVRRWVVLSIGSTFAIILLWVCVVNFGFFRWFCSPSCGDSSLERYGWQELSVRFDEFWASDSAAGLMPSNCDSLRIYSGVWHEASHLDTYIATPRGIDLLTISEPGANLFYEKLSQMRGNFTMETPAYYIVSECVFSSGSFICRDLGITDQTVPCHVVPIRRGGCEVKRFLVYRVNRLEP